MKFEYDSKSDERKCVAYIDDDGDLIMADILGVASAVSLGSDGAATYREITFDPKKAVHKFYPGDKITITF